MILEVSTRLLFDSKYISFSPDYQYNKTHRFASVSTLSFSSSSLPYYSYVKITLARKGLLRPNERLFAPVVYYTRASNLSFLSESRRLALVNNSDVHHSIPSPLEDPDAWQGRAEEISFKKGFFGGKKQSYKIAILLPAPLIYGSESSSHFYSNFC